MQSLNSCKKLKAPNLGSFSLTSRSKLQKLPDKKKKEEKNGADLDVSLIIRQEACPEQSQRGRH